MHKPEDLPQEDMIPSSSCDHTHGGMISPQRNVVGMGKCGGMTWAFCCDSIVDVEMPSPDFAVVSGRYEDAILTASYGYGIKLIIIILCGQRPSLRAYDHGVLLWP